MAMIQLAIEDPAYARCVRSLLLRNGAHRQVYITDLPELNLGGVIVITKKKLDKLSPARKDIQRLLVIAKNDHESLSQLWAAGIRHVVFEADSPATAALAILALEASLFQRDRVASSGGFH